MGVLKKTKGSGRSNLSASVGSSANDRGSESLNGSTEIGKPTSAAAYIPLNDRSTGTSRSGDLVYIVYFVLGTGFLLPWNAFITAVDYFDYLYPNSHIDRIFSVAYLFPCLVILALLVSYGQNLGSRARINFGLGLFFICIVVVPIMEALVITGRRGSSMTYFVTVGAVAMAGVGDALVQGTLIGSAGQLPDKYMQAIVSGTGFSGVLVSFLRIVTKEAFPATPRGLRTSANIYFTVSAVFLVICVLSYNAVHRLTVAMAGMDGFEDVAPEGLGRESSSDLAMDHSGGSCESETNKATFRSYGGGQQLQASEVGGQGSPRSVEGLEEGEDIVCKTKSTLHELLLQLKWLAAAFALIYVTTLAIFPGFLTEDVTSAFLGDWYPVLLITCYNVFDLAGKSLPPQYGPSKQVSTFGWAAARLLFFPLYSACIHGPRIFRTEIPVFVLTALLGLSNGYLTTCSFLLAPKSVKRGADADAAGVVMVMALAEGLTLGSLVSWIWVV